jgi:hypothetical protein
MDDDIPQLIHCNSSSLSDYESPRIYARKFIPNANCHETQGDDGPETPVSHMSQQSHVVGASPSSKSRKKKFLAALSPKLISSSSRETRQSSTHDRADIYKPRQSQTSGLSHVVRPPDGNTWREVVAKHKTTGRIRSYFLSDLTGEKCWDEPPSGASHIVLASRHDP